MRIETWNDVDSLILNAIPEGPSLEYKAALALGPDGQRVEAMKDLTGMGNGGGGTLIYGVHEDPANEGVPAGTRPLEDRSLVGVLEDIVRSFAPTNYVVAHYTLYSFSHVIFVWGVCWRRSFDFLLLL